MTNNTFYLKKETHKRDWLTLDAKGKTLGRLASEIAKILRGKHKPTYTPHMDSGDGVIILNADKIHVTGAKAAQKLYRNHTGWRLNEVPYARMLERKPAYIIKHAVKGMMPKGILGRHQMKRLKIFVGEEHGMEAQKPVQVNI